MERAILDRVLDLSHELILWLARLFGQPLDELALHWLHPVLHVVLIWVPAAFLLLASRQILRTLSRRLRNQAQRFGQPEPSGGIAPGYAAFVISHSRKAQMALVAASFALMPLLYATLELPKLIINSVISADAYRFPMIHFGLTVSKLEHLLFFCILFLLALVAVNAMKYSINSYKTRLSQRLARRIRLGVFRAWRRSSRARHADAIPLITQEVEPVGSFGGDLLVVPALQGGTFLTILTFMFVQNPILGLSAVSLLPLQLWLIPALQRRINEFGRQRILVMRALGERLGDQLVDNDLRGAAVVQTAARLFRELELLQRRRDDVKFAAKALNNLLFALTPFFFYSIGGYLVIRGDLSFGSLVAAIAAHKEMSPPLRELFTYYQDLQDVRTRYAEIRRFLTTRSPAPHAAPTPVPI